MNGHRLFQGLYTAFIVVGLLVAYWLRLGNGYGEFMRAFLYVVAPATAALMSIIALIRFGKNGGYQPILASFAIALSLWTVGEGLWVYYENILRIDPFPSIADGFYIAAYPFFALAVIVALKKKDFSLLKSDAIIRFLMTIVVTVSVGLLAYYGLYLVRDTDLSTASNMITIGYAIGDIVLIALSLFVVILAWEFRGGSLMRLWLCILTAFLFILLADIGFSSYNTAYTMGDPWIKNTLDSCWILGYLFFALGYSSYLSSISSAQSRLSRAK